jgi:hypothetical protein
MELLDCHWCGSAGSVENGICQICLMEYPYEADVIQLPLENARVRAGTTVDLTETEVVAAE